MAVWETTASVVFWDSNGILTSQNTVISKITDNKSETTLEVNEDIKVTRGANVLDGKFLGTVTVDDVEYPVVSVFGLRYIVGLGGKSGIPARLAASDLDTSGSFTVCFFPGTLIATTSGERKVEELVSGDLVLIGNSGAIPSTWLGRKFARAVSVKWIGRQTVSTLFGPAERLMPVRFTAGSLGGGGGATPSAA